MAEGPDGAQAADDPTEQSGSAHSATAVIHPDDRPGTARGEARVTSDSRGFDRVFAIGLGTIAAVAMGIRVATLSTIAKTNATGGDPYWYHTQANLLADGHGFADPFILQQEHIYTPGIQHPPLYTIWLAIPSFLGAHSYGAHKLMSCLAGTLAVIFIGLAARKIAGRWAGLIAAGLAAVYPSLWVIDGLLWAEGLFAALIALTIWFAYRWVDRPSVGRAVALGVAIGLATLTRAEAVALVVLLVVPLMVVRKGLVRRKRIVMIVGTLAGVVVLVAPWSIRNAVQFKDFEPFSTNASEIFIYANNPYAYGLVDQAYVCAPNKNKPNGVTLNNFGNAYLGFWFFPWQEYQRCLHGEPKGDLTQKAQFWRKEAFDYANAHRSRLPAVAAARLGRAWGVYRPFQSARLMQYEGRTLWVSRLGVWCWWGVFALGIGGAVVLWRRRVTIIPVVSMALLVTAISLYGYGSDRFRTPADVAALILAGVALDAAVRWFSRRREDVSGSSARHADPSTAR